ncbi:hypothetical protein II906_03270, partial [bacterium]|nr:hypothetical protein [bacterium]
MKINNLYPMNTGYLKAAVKKLSVGNSAEQKDKEINELSNIYYQPVNFGRSKAEHKSWGAQINPETKEASFKILTFPDTQRVTVTVEKRDDRTQKKEYELENKGEGVFEIKEAIPKGEVEHGDIYYYTLYKADGKVDKVKDPYSYRQETLLGESTIYDHSLYEWKDEDWFKNNKNRISRNANAQNGLKALSEAKIYEFNTATLTKQGDFEAAKSALNALPKMGFNAIEIMPTEATYSFNWGYDGVDKMAPSEHLGGPDGLKSLVDYAHSIGLNVIMDMVPNHLGPDGASLGKTGPYVAGPNAFGEKFNFEGENSKYVRDYIINSAFNWIENYHCDGLRLDMTKYMESDNTMKQLAAEVHYHYPDAFLIVEDGRSNVKINKDGTFSSSKSTIHDMRVMNPIPDEETGVNSTEEEHCSAIDRIGKNQTSLASLGFDSEWDFSFYHELKEALYGIVDLDKIEKVSASSENRVKYVMSHDEIGNFEGSRLIAKLMVPTLHLNQNVYLNDEDNDRAADLMRQKGMSQNADNERVTVQKAQFVAEKLAIMLQTGALDKYDTKDIHQPNYINSVNEAFQKEV